MNDFSNCIESLNSLKSHLKYVKTEFEAEGTRNEELSILKSIVRGASTDLVVKIGGSYALRDVLQSHTLSAVSTLVPMIETKEAMNSFITRRNTLKEDIQKLPYFMINIETITSINNIFTILDAAMEDSDFSGVVIGRSDLTDSMGLKKEATDSPEILDLCKSVLRTCKKRGLYVTCGGNITANSYDFIKVLLDEGLNSFETRKCCISCKNLNGSIFKKLLSNALEFEKLILSCYKNLASTYTSKVSSRISSLNQRK